MIEVPFDNIIVNNNYFIEFRGEDYEQLNNYAKELKIPIKRTQLFKPSQVSGKFFGKCTGRIPSIPSRQQGGIPIPEKLIWELLPGRLSNEGADAFYVFQKQESFHRRRDITYYLPAPRSISSVNNMDINTLISIMTKEEIPSSVYVDENTKALYHGVIPLHELKIGKFYLIDVSRGDRDFINGKNNAIKMRKLGSKEKLKLLESNPTYALSGSIIAMFMRTINEYGNTVTTLDEYGNTIMLGNDIIDKYQFCAIQNINELLETRPLASSVPGFESYDRYISGLARKISSDDCILLSPFDFTVRNVDVQEMFVFLEKMEKDNAEYEKNKCQHCTMSGGKRKNKKRKNKTKRRKSAE